VEHENACPADKRWASRTNKVLAEPSCSPANINTRVMPFEDIGALSSAVLRQSRALMETRNG
jgi:hypothetical protein